MLDINSSSLGNLQKTKFKTEYNFIFSLQEMFIEHFQILAFFLIIADQRIYRRRQWHPTPVLLPGKSHGRRSLVGCSPWGCEESDTTEQLHFHFSLSCIGEGNGNPLQCSCLENPRDGGAWWAAVWDHTESDTTEVIQQLSSREYIISDTNTSISNQQQLSVNIRGSG